jgi:hypothetical protein
MVVFPLYRLAAFASLFSAITTSLLIFLPSSGAAGFYEKLALHSNNLYLFKKWVLLFHPMFAYLAMIGLAVYFFKRKAHLVIPGLFFGLIWALTEMAQQAYTIVALNNYWRPGYSSAVDEQSKNAFFAQLESYTAIYDSMYFLVILGFGVASVLFGFALISGNKFSKMLGVLNIMIGVFSLFNFISDYLQVTSLLPIVNFWYQWCYSYLQPLWRIMLALWLWQLASQYKNVESV